ncbi:dTDP-4-dehydrorhamnose reductase [Jatrophihabitans endophyticus]|uniref:dTDP-4-dehydrorhamnose reductase n=1 Tax=Jatrophihabitans endophyticus TaxID=1206085 RepID=A0A1M5U6G5_9ACTN|nr:dTDP-4-dehydrorhamnose reductase [Jatrophihabitans endophyticus]SHH58528.1 dTDP-4-dehydrorhamnose reductase [Jatrophihabitans endophyticus]
MRWLVTGGGGQLATRAVDLLDGSGDDVVALTSRDLDITDAAAVERAVADVRPDVVLNAAAYTAVDAAETDEATAAAVNEDGPRLLAEALARHGGRLLHVSTDYVFDGAADTPYDIGDPTGPRTAYGRTKLAGEQRVRAALPDRSHVVRTAWVYGGPGANFVDTMRRLEGERETVSVVADQLGCPTWARDLAAGLLELGRADVPGGVLHFVNAGQASWHDLAREVFRLVGADPGRVEPTDTASFPRPAPRPAWSVLSTRAWVAAGLTAPRPWRDALAAYLAAAPAV